ncbi:MAG: hypothetical protein E6767_20540, partial [Dysgonomonas sp.]|nr:hypothetical protein [Dysgonomonas sp.]
MKHIIYKIILSVLLIILGGNGYLMAQIDEDFDPYEGEECYYLNTSGEGHFTAPFLKSGEPEPIGEETITRDFIFIDKRNFDSFTNNPRIKFSLSFTADRSFFINYIYFYWETFYQDIGIPIDCYYTMTDPSGYTDTFSINTYSGWDNWYNYDFPPGNYTISFEMQFSGPFEEEELPEELKDKLFQNCRMYFVYNLYPKENEPDPSTPSIPSTASFSSDQNYIHSRTFTSEDGKNY